MNTQEVIARELDAGNLYDIAEIKSNDDHAATFAAMQADSAARQRLKVELGLTTKQLNKLVTAELIARRNKRYR